MLSQAQLHRKISFNASLATRGVDLRKVTTGEAPIEFKALVNDLGFTEQDFQIDAGQVHATELHVWRGTPGADKLSPGDIMQELGEGGEVVREHTIRRVQPEAQKVVFKCTVEGE